MSSTRSQLLTLLGQKILDGGRRTTAAFVRVFETEAIDSYVNKTDDLDINGGYLGIASGRVDVTKINSATPLGYFLSDSGTWTQQSVTPLFNRFSTTGNTTTTETDLVSNTIAAGQLTADGDKLKAEYGGNFAGNATASARIRVYFGGTSIFDTTAISVPAAASWVAKVTIIRASSSSVRYMISLTTEEAPLAAYTSVGEVTGLTLSNTNVLRISGQASGGGAASNDITLLLSEVNYYKKA
jgi:hypothetical protein